MKLQPEAEAKPTPAEWYYKAADDDDWVLVEKTGKEEFIALDNSGALLIDQSNIPEELGDVIMVKYTYQVTNAQSDTLEVNIIQTVPLETAETSILK